MKTVAIYSFALLALLAACQPQKADTAKDSADASLQETVAEAAPLAAPAPAPAVAQSAAGEMAEANTAEELAFFDRIDAILTESERRAAAEAQTKSRALGGDLLGQAEAMNQLSPKSEDGVHWGFSDASGNFVIKPQFAAVKTFSEGLAPVFTDKQKWGFVDTKGSMTIAPRFDRVQVTGFREGRVIAVAKDTFGYINTAGKYIDGYFAVHKGKKKKRK